MAEKDSSKFKSGAEHPRAIDRMARLRELKKLNLGTLKIVGDAIISGERSRQMIQAHCNACGKSMMLFVENVMKGATRNCRCQRRLMYKTEKERMLGGRYDAALQRCRNPNNPSYPNYGGRGIDLRFSRSEYIEFFSPLFPDKDFAKFEIDRYPNKNGHYERGNVRVVPRAVNLRNKRNNRIAFYKGEEIVAADMYDRLKADHPDFSLSKGRVAKLAADGMPPEEILQVPPRHGSLRKRKGALVRTSVMRTKRY